MGEKSIENVKIAFELCTEKFHKIFEPLTKAFMESLFLFIKTRNLQANFAFVEAIGFGPTKDAVNIAKDVVDHMLSLRPFDVDESIWKIGVNICVMKTLNFMKMLTSRRWNILFLHAFVRHYPEGKALAFQAMKHLNLTPSPIVLSNIIKTANSKTRVLEFVTKFASGPFLLDQARFFRAMKKLYPNDDTYHPQMKIFVDQAWQHPIRDRSRSHISKTKYGVKEIPATDPRLVRKDSFMSLTNIYKTRDGGDLDFLMMEKTVFISKTALSMNETDLKIELSEHIICCRSNYNYTDRIEIPIPAYVIHERKGAYAAALKYFQDNGFTVIEGVEIVKKVIPYKKKEQPLYSKLAPGRNLNWASTFVEDQFSDPTHFFYGTKATLKFNSSRECPDHDLTRWFVRKNPKTVMISHLTVSENLIKKGVIPLDTGICNWYLSYSANKARMMNVLRASYIKDNTNFPLSFLKYPDIQLELGMEPVDETDTDFWYESEGLTLLLNTAYHPLVTLRKKIKSDSDAISKSDPEMRNIERLCKLTKIFQDYSISSLWSSTSDADKPALVVKIIAAMKMFQ